VSSEELGGMVILAVYGALLVLAVKVFGIRRVLWAIGLVVFFAVAIAFKSLGAFTGGRRY
jgi:hypothetical protein